jgi:ribonuclease R
MKIALKQLLGEVALAYQGSDIEKLCGKKSKQWTYSLVDGSGATSQPLLVGFNWGAGKNGCIEPQDFDKEGSFLPPALEGSMARIRPYLIKHLKTHSVEKMNQTNYCFFRSATENQITPNDLERCKPLFNKLITLLQPSEVVCFSSKLRDYLVSTKKVNINEDGIKQIGFKRGKGVATYTAMKGHLESGTAICFLPHPNYPMPGPDRNQAWDFCLNSPR